MHAVSPPQNNLFLTTIYFGEFTTELRLWTAPDKCFINYKPSEPMTVINGARQVL